MTEELAADDPETKFARQWSPTLGVLPLGTAKRVEPAMPFSVDGEVDPVPSVEVTVRAGVLPIVVGPNDSR